MGWIGWTGWNTGFFLISESVFTVGSSWFLLMICKASWVLPKKHFPLKKKKKKSIQQYSHTYSKPLESARELRMFWKSRGQLLCYSLESCSASVPAPQGRVWAGSLGQWDFFFKAPQWCSGIAQVEDLSTGRMHRRDLEPCTDSNHVFQEAKACWVPGTQCPSSSAIKRGAL